MVENGTPIRAQRMAPAGRALALVVALSVIVPGSGPTLQLARAQDTSARGMPIIRDTEIEQLLREYAAPVLRAANLSQQGVRVVMLNDRTFNAFVMDGRHIFINTGALFDAKTPNEIIGVFAHETGHLAGGHLSRLREQLSRAQTASIIALLAGVGAIVAGARSGSGDVGAAAILAPQTAITRSLLAYVRTQEDQADHAGVKFLNATGQSPRGMLELFKRLADESLFNSRYVDPYMQSHPMPADRIAALEQIAKASPYWDHKDPPELQLRHDMMRAKLSGFLDRPDTVVRRYPLSDHSLPARYARAISSYRHGDGRAAVAQIDDLIRTQPNNPYFYELKGQALLEGGHPDEAIPMLRGALAREPESSDAYAQLAMAYGRKGDLANADLASAQAAFMRGDVKTAQQLASRAKTRLPVGSPGWVRADDIVSVKPANATR